MITKQTASELVTLGGRHRAAYLIPQAGYTLGIATADGDALAALLPAGFLEALAVVRDDVDKARQDKAAIAAEAKQATSTQNEQLRALKVWRRKASNRARRVVRAGGSVPAELVLIGSNQSVPAILDQTSKVLSLLAENAATLATMGPAVEPLIEEGRKLYQALDQADTTQEKVRASELPASVVSFYAKKGELYTGLKIINDAGHELHAHDAQAAAKYNLSILYRRSGQGAGVPAPGATVTAPSTSPS